MRRVLAAVGTVALVGAAAVVLGSEGADAEPTEAVYEFTGEADVFAVPADVCQVTIEAIGAEGGDGDQPGGPIDEPGSVGGPTATGFGALGGSVIGTVAVTPGEILEVVVGGAGGSAEQDIPSAARASGDPGALGTVSGPIPGGDGGFNGGGTGGTGADVTGGSGNPAGGGGGASEVFRDSSALVVAGGGGGGAGYIGAGNGGAGGQTGEPGNDGTTGNPDNKSNGDPARGGESGGDGGAGGAGATGPQGGSDGGDGSPGQGGEGALGLDAGGGGGGGTQGGGGGGSNDTGAFAGGGGGGGGSSTGPAGATFATGVDSGDPDGNGLIVITYDPAANTCGAPSPVVVEPRFTG